MKPTHAHQLPGLARDNSHALRWLHQNGGRMTSPSIINGMRETTCGLSILLTLVFAVGCAPLGQTNRFAQSNGPPADPYHSHPAAIAQNNTPSAPSASTPLSGAGRQDVTLAKTSHGTQPSTAMPPSQSPADPLTVRGQSPPSASPYSAAPYGQSAGVNPYGQGSTPATSYGAQGGYSPYGSAPAAPATPAANTNYASGVSGSGTVQPVQFEAQGPNNLFIPPPPAGLIPGVTDPAGLLAGPTVPLDINVAETRTGRFMFGAGVNSDLGVTGQISIDERNFDIWRVPRSWDDVMNGRAFRGGGQGLRLEAMPGSQVQRYMASLTEPYLFDTNISLTLSGYFFDRRYDDWDEQRLGGRVGLGYRLTPDLSVSAAVRGENVNIHDPRILVPDLAEAVGDNSLFSGRFTVAHDTRDTPFFPTQGHYIELGYEQVFGSFDYPRFNAELRKYFLLNERPDGSGRHTMAYSFRMGMSGDEQPIYENYFAGGFSTMRGFDFRGASPVNGGVQVGGAFQFLGTMEYLFPLTADDMVKGVLFVDFGTVEEKIEINPEDYRVAPGFGLRIAIPALGPAPLALDFAIPVARENTDDIQNFSFYFGMGRN